MAHYGSCSHQCGTTGFPYCRDTPVNCYTVPVSFNSNLIYNTQSLSRGVLRACRRLVRKQITFFKPKSLFFRRITCPLCQSGIQRAIKGNRDLDLSELPRNLKKMASLLQAMILRLMMHQLDSMVLGTGRRATGCVK